MTCIFPKKTLFITFTINPRSTILITNCHCIVTSVSSTSPIVITLRRHSKQTPSSSPVIAFSTKLPPHSSTKTPRTKIYPFILKPHGSNPPPC